MAKHPQVSRRDYVDRDDSRAAVHCREDSGQRGKAEEALQQLREIMGKLKLTVNEEKTRICKVPEGEFDFLGYTFGRM